MIRYALALFVLGLSAGCVKPPGPAERASDAARTLNVNSRYGELASVIGMTARGVRNEFLSRRSEWGKLVQVVDVELAGLTMADAGRASVLVDFSWTRQDQSVLRTTRVLQEWQDESGTWQLVREKRVSGDLGLFGEQVAAIDPKPRPDVHFETRVIR